MLTQPLLGPDCQGFVESESNCDALASSAGNSAAGIGVHDDKRKSVVSEDFADRQPWETLILPRHTDREDSLVGGSPRSVQTALSMAESIGYSKEFILPLEDIRRSEFQPVPDGILLASVLCLSVLVILLTAATSYVIMTMVI